MTVFGEVSTAYSLWIDAVAAAANGPLERFRTVRRIEAEEDGDRVITMRLAPTARTKEGDLPRCHIDITKGGAAQSLSGEWRAALRGAHVELLLPPSRFLFRPLELPRRSVEFLDGIIRAQIDRLTPWNASEAIYRWTRPRDVASDRTVMTVVATSRESAIPLAQKFFDLGAASVEISTKAPDDERVIVHKSLVGGQSGVGRIRPVLSIGLAVTGVLAVLSVGVGGFLADSYEQQQQLMQREIASRRAVMRASQSGSGSSPLDMLVRRKQETPASVMTIEALSAQLPDHTYATEVRIEGDKLQIVGLTRDAPSLIQILEQSPYFSSAGFFAPTTKSANEPGERFHIEVKLKPYFGMGT
jgi:general secretion pathway protein L